MISRRRFLRLSAYCTAPWLVRLAGVGERQARAAASNQPVVVVGAGLAGLQAANVLRKAGRRVLILEARSHPGGRVQTFRAPFDMGLYAEAGPIRIAGSHTTVLRLVREFGLNLLPFESSNGSALISIGGSNIRADALGGAKVPLKLRGDEQRLQPNQLLERYVGQLPGDLAGLEPSPASFRNWATIDQLTWPDWLRSRGASAAAVELMTLGGDSSQLSALYVLRQFALLRAATYYKIEGGMDLLPRAMVASLRDIVRFNAAVVRMDQTSGLVRVDYLEDGRMKSIGASRVIVTTPLTTLRQIEIRPPFSREKESAIEHLPYFPATRFLLQSRSRFWYASRLSGYARTDQPAEIWDCTYNVQASAGILGVTVGGALGRKTLDLSPEQSVVFGTDLAAAAFPAIRSELQKGVAQRWALEPWSKGAFAVFYPGQMASMMPHLARPEGLLHFAGEHTSSWMGWMEGALASGERAAREVLSQGS
ncbi:MAG: FAD-dependent oxidoreductase [Candidatus Acidiferrales bacterium]